MERRQFLQTFTGATTMLLSSAEKSYAAHTGDAGTLSDHIIEQVNTKKVRMYYPRYVSMNSQRGPHGCEFDDTVCEIITNQGAKGWGVPLWRTTEKEAKDFIVGKKMSEIFDPQTGILDKRAAFCDIALYDLAGVILNKPVYEILGAATPETFKCYSGMIYFDDLTRFYNKPLGMDLIVQECAFDYAVGYRQFKLKIGRGFKYTSKSVGMQRDIEVTKLVARNFPDCEILVDGNDGLTLGELQQYLEGIKDVSLFWIEEPFVENVEDYTRLKAFLQQRNIKTLLADGEASPIDHQLLSKLESMKLLDVRLNDIQDIGFSGWRQLMSQLKKSGTLASPHAWGSQLKTHVISHLTAAYGNTATIEGVTCISEEVDFGDYELKEGKLIPSGAPGFGMKLLK